MNLKLALSVLFILTLSLTFASGADVAYVVKTTSNPAIISILQDLGYSYKVIPNTAIPSENFSEYPLILIQEDVANKNLIPFSTSNSIFLAKEIAPLVWSGGSITTTQAFQARFEALNTPFSETFSDPLVNIYTSSKSIQSFAIIPSGVKKAVFSIGSSSYGYSIVAYSNSTHKNVFFGIPEINYWTPETKQIFKNSVKWIKEGSDFDKDGYMDNVDCNDNNASIHPGVVDWPYNYIDENCDGYDLADVDGEGYCNQGYLIQNATLQCNKETGAIGTDCNDQRAYINPNASETLGGSDLNCRDEPPVLLNNISQITWNQYENATNVFDLHDYFDSYDSYPLTFSQYNLSSGANITAHISNGVVTLEPIGNWHGNAWIQFMAIDPFKFNSTTNKINLTVLFVNQPPVMEPIEDIYSVEGDFIKIVPQVVDPDTSYTLNFSSPLDENGEWQTKIGESGVYLITITATDEFGLTSSQSFTIYLNQKIFINEVSSDSISGPEWVELYNPQGYPVSLTGCVLQDKSNNKLVLSAEIESKNVSSFYLYSNINKTADSISLICSGELIDKVSYGLGSTLPAPAKGQSLGRITDGSEEFMLFNYPTKGVTNIADLEPPKINLIAPENDSFIEVRNMNFTFSVTDNSQTSILCTLYFGASGVFTDSANMAVQNNTVNYFSEENLPDQTYSWKIQCSDGQNVVESATRFFTLNAPEAPVVPLVQNIVVHETEKVILNITALDADNRNISYELNSSKFSQQSAVLSSGKDFVSGFDTNYGDAGIYYFTLNVSNYFFSEEQEFQVTILRKDRVPVISAIPNISILEDTPTNLQIIASDPDNDTLTYSVLEENSSRVNCEFNENNLSLAPVQNWYGNASCIIAVSDGEMNETATVYISVISVNDRPVLESIPDTVSSEGERATITVHASDIENSELTYTINDSRFHKVGNNMFIWTTNYTDSGIYYANVTVSDGEDLDSKIAKIIIEDSNEPPYLTIENQTVAEHSGTFLVNITSWDNDGNVTGYRVAKENSSQVHCFMNSSSLMISPIGQFNGIAACSIQAIDNLNKASASFIFHINVTPVDDPPAITSFAPSINPFVAKYGRQIFTVSYADPDTFNANITASWYVNDSFQSTGNSFTFQPNGTYENANVTVLISDGNNSISHSWELLFVDRPVTDGFTGSTTNFSILNDSQITNVKIVLQKENGKIEFLDSADARTIADFVNYAQISKAFMSLDSDYLFALKNKRARLTFYNLPYTKTPTVYYLQSFSQIPVNSGNVCPSNICSDIVYNNLTKVLTMSVPSFSSYFVGDILTCSAKGGSLCGENANCSGSIIEALEDNCCLGTCKEIPPAFTDVSERCENITGHLIVTVTDPKSNDNLNVNDPITGRFSVNNGGDEDTEFDVYVSLYDLTKDESLDDTSTTISVDSGTKESGDFTLTIPSDVDETDKFAIFIKTDDGTLCSEDYQKINLKKEDHQVDITKVTFDQDLYTCGNTVNVEVRGQNNGKNAEKGTNLQIKIPTLSINSFSETFDLTKDGSKNKFVKNLEFTLPTNLSEGVYPVSISVLATETTTVQRTITIGKCTSSTESVIPSQPISPLPLNVSGKNTDYTYLLLLTFSVLLVILALLYLVAKRKNKTEDSEETE